MVVYSLNLNKADYAYSIAYHQGNDDMTLDTNEEALNSMKLAIEAVTEAVRIFAEVGNNYEVKVNKVKFGNDGKDHSIQFTAQTFSKDIYPKRIINSAMTIRQPGEREKDVAADRAKLLLNIDALKSEVERYLNGDRAQAALDFGDEIDEEEAADVEIEDIYLATPEDDDTPLCEDIDIFE